MEITIENGRTSKQLTTIRCTQPTINDHPLPPPHIIQQAGQPRPVHGDGGCRQHEKLVKSHPRRDIVLGLLASTPLSAIELGSHIDRSVLLRIIVPDSDSDDGVSE